MLTFERQEAILQLLELQKVAKLSELTQATGASESTIRRDLSELEKQKKIKRIHGGASLPTRKTDEPSLQDKEFSFTEAKQAIGRLAAGLIKDGDSIFVDAGSSTAAILPWIQARRITIVTNGLNIAAAAADNDFTTYVLGGYVKSGTRAFIGRAAVEALEQYRFDKAFLGTNGVDADFGYSTPDPEEASIKQLALRQAQEGYVLADASKLDQTSFSHIARLEEAVLLTEMSAEHESLLHRMRDYTIVKAVEL
ncbi:DeoR/GlpR family DNA-binding transcription regulator [Alkalicoccus chagannorensis]|uniref:DeoR/GlpR family DNA-binding transcription regulator n=1 Tax=Alkalicoccus chagannorensis TaxID=427072 RepID=UPI000412C4C9|nr:DeoR/GlpR family DNA-binding transcription regulator [Alkalicoccus chagannorensis]